MKLSICSQNLYGKSFSDLMDSEKMTVRKATARLTVEEEIEEQTKCEQEHHDRIKDPGQWFCPRCGQKLDPVSKDNEDWGDFCSGYHEEHGTFWFLCSNKDCVMNENPLVVHHPVYGWKCRSGDSWAIGYVK